MKNNEKYLNEYLHQVARRLMLHASNLINLGIFDGKLGIATFFFHYSRYTNHTLYDDFAGELFDEILEEVHVRIPLSFNDGLCGIGWGIMYLWEKGFIEGDIDEVLADIDSKVMEIAPLRVKDITFETGLEGIASYCYSRERSLRKKSRTFFDELDLSCLKAGLPCTEEFFHIDIIWKKILENYSLNQTSLPNRENWKKGLILLTDI